MTAKRLIVTYSLSGTTTKLAKLLQTQTAADFVELTVAPGTFPADMFAAADVATAQIENDQLPALTSQLPDIRAYDTILVGGPVWSGKVATPLRTFMKDTTTFTGTFAPFYTDVNSAGNYEGDFAQLAGNRPVAKGLEMTGNQLRNQAQATDRLTNWLTTLSK